MFINPDLSVALDATRHSRKMQDLGKIEAAAGSSN
jgi:hypothetical protein